MDTPNPPYSEVCALTQAPKTKHPLSQTSKHTNLSLEIGRKHSGLQVGRQRGVDATNYALQRPHHPLDARLAVGIVVEDLREDLGEAPSCIKSRGCGIAA